MAVTNAAVNAEATAAAVTVKAIVTVHAEATATAVNTKATTATVHAETPPPQRNLQLPKEVSVAAVVATEAGTPATSW